ncbi:MAG TPA: endonuclease/exonuclease/phosphatase family protein, partial [Dehalococcoidia bacterium]|nr:endonuclease/exonuclease/phosphatase family protein [Dehalococcoidia bacterium]
MRPAALIQFVIALCLLPASPAVAAPPAVPGPVTLRIATFNLNDVRTADLRDPAHPRLRRLAEVIQRLRPNILLLNEIAYDQPGAPDCIDSEPPGLNAQRFVDAFLAREQVPGLPPIRYRAFMAPVNTGAPSGFDLDNDGRIVSSYPRPAAQGPDGSPAPPSDDARAYAADCWGFGTFPGQYAMALLVDERLVIDTPNVRTFRTLPWDYMPGALLPTLPDSEHPWFSDDELRLVRLSSKSHWDVPVILPNGARLHLLCSHPTPPAFDGPEKRNARRNRDEIRFWIDYIENEAYIVDDRNAPGGLADFDPFVILGDLNADPDEGSAWKNPVGTLLLSSPHVLGSFVPISELPVAGLDPDDTAAFGLRVDYVLPSSDLRIVTGG